LLVDTGNLRYGLHQHPEDLRVATFHERKRHHDVEASRIAVWLARLRRTTIPVSYDTLCEFPFRSTLVVDCISAPVPGLPGAYAHTAFLFVFPRWQILPVSGCGRATPVLALVTR
jgi:hypothetical protein